MITEKYSVKERSVSLRQELKEYEASIKRITAKEREFLQGWVNDDNSVYCNPFYIYDDYGRLVDYITAFRRYMKEHKAALRKELKEYEAAIVDLTEEERKDLREWVANGNSVKENPGWLCGENGRPLDYIEAHRITVDMMNNPGDYGIGVEPKVKEEYIPEDEIPF